MNHELAKTLTTALVQFVDRERPEGTMCCSNTDCANLENAFNSENFAYIEAYIKMKLLGGLTEFENALRQIIEVTLSDEVPNGSGGTMSWAVALSDDDIKKLAPRVLAIAKNELLSYADERNPAIEAMANLERTYFCNPDKLPKWLKDDIARKELNAHTKGYNKGYKDASEEYNKCASYHFPTVTIRPLCWEPGGTCTNPQMDCINCPRKTSGGMLNTSSGTSTLKAEG